MSISDPNLADIFSAAMEGLQNKQRKAYEDFMEATKEVCLSHRQFVKSKQDTCVKKCKDDEILFDSIQAFKKDMEQMDISLKKRQKDISAAMSEVQQKESQKADIIQKIERLQDELAKRKEIIESQNKANKDRLRNLQKARLVFQEHLGLEIRTIHGKTQLSKGEKLQFVFRNINPSDQDSPYVVTMGITTDRVYQIVSSDPVIESLPVLEKRLQETNNLAAFLANVRKEFVSLARR